MVYSYRYTPRKKRIIATSFVFAFLLLMFISIGSLVYISYFIKNLEAWMIIVSVVVLGIIMIPLMTMISNYIERNSLWDKVTLDNEKLSSERFGEIKVKDITIFKVNDLNKIFSFKIYTEKKKLNFSGLDILGDSGGKEYQGDIVALKAMANEIERIISEQGLNVRSSKESSSTALFVVLCLAMVMLIPGLIFAPQRMIFVIPFVVPLFFYALKKRKEQNQVDKK
ncbi:hypothetical protein [Serratia sp. DD3]|uniref:hypothetical protein n=1 Tax=Serratia sp. DD3 TaxID=1410619 RepID=UPI0004D94669|nr:hypothetical protein [Serratia sp. DD3]KEY57161.1 hypothetical protein SRDD_39300 [Serratia sp. DD3]KEY58772.1 hypothetical protein SRDD_23000 [Serratia sp. DD3]